MTNESRPAQERTSWLELTDPELEAARDRGCLVLVPIGAVEQHGSHLPSGTDISIAQAVAEAAAARLGNTVVAPGIPWGYSVTHMSFASTLSLRPQTMTNVLHDICGSLVAHGFLRIAIVSSHATNRPVGQLFVHEFASMHGVPVAFAHYSDFVKEAYTAIRQTAIGGEMHAGEFETSIQMHLQPELVKPDNPASHYVDPVNHFGISSAAKDFTQAGSITVGYDIKKLFPEGVMGDAGPASSEVGRLLFEHVVTGISAALDEYRNFGYGDRAEFAVERTPESWHRIR